MGHVSYTCRVRAKNMIPTDRPLIHKPVKRLLIDSLEPNLPGNFGNNDQHRHKHSETTSAACQTFHVDVIFV